MMAFLILAGSLVLGVWYFLLPPLWRQRDDQGDSDLTMLRRLYRDKAAEIDADVISGQIGAELHAVAQEELKQDLACALSSTTNRDMRTHTSPQRWPILLLAVGLPMGAAGIYWQVGHPDSLRKVDATPVATNHPLGRADVESMIAQLARRLEVQSDDFAGWAMLGRSFTVIGRYSDAATAYAKAVALNAHDATILLEYADLLGVLRGKDLRGQPSQLVQRALEIDPNHPKALALAGTAAFNEHQYVQAADYWERLLRLLDPGSESASGVAKSIAEAKALASGRKMSPMLPAPPSLAGTVVLSPALAAQVGPDDSLFVYARPVDGTPMPVAVLKRYARDLPLRFELDDSLSIISGKPLSSFDQVLVGARLSRSGQAMPSSGDLEGLLSPVNAGSRNLLITIDRVRP